MWCLFRPVDSIIDSLVLFLVFILFLLSISSIYCRLRLSFSFLYLSCYLSFSKGSILTRPNPLACMCLGSKHVCFSSDVACIYVYVCVSKCFFLSISACLSLIYLLVEYGGDKNSVLKKGTVGQKLPISDQQPKILPKNLKTHTI